ncbi:unnamed protein product, partial [Oncorhynchus mykiss]
RPSVLTSVSLWCVYDRREEVCSEAQRVLRALPAKNSEKEGRKPMPSFPDMVAYIQEKAAQRMKTPAKYTVGTYTLPFNPSAFGEIVLYLRMCLAHSAGATPVSKSLADMQDDAPAIGRYTHALLSDGPLTSPSSTGTKGAEVNPVQVYMELLQQLLSAVGGESPCDVLSSGGGVCLSSQPGPHVYPQDRLDQESNEHQQGGPKGASSSALRCGGVHHVRKRTEDCRSDAHQDH